MRPLNGAFCGLAMNQSAFATRFLLDRLPGISEVMLLLDPFDMSTCRTQKATAFSISRASATKAAAPS